MVFNCTKCEARIVTPSGPQPDFVDCICGEKVKVPEHKPKSVQDLLADIKKEKQEKLEEKEEKQETENPIQKKKWWAFWQK